MWYEGLLNLSAWQVVLATLVLTQITIMSVTIYLHRYSAHNALELNGALKHFFRFWLWLTTSQNTKQWTAVHRKHHAKCETEEDPHSPVVKGLGTVFFRGAELYKEAALDQETLDRYGQRTPEDWIERNIYTPYQSVGIFIMLALDMLLFGAIGITVWAIQMLWIPVFAAGVINGVGHAWGYRNFECKDAARNIVPWGLFIGGEELHNNHHTYPNSARLAVKKWELDIGWFYIRIFSALGLAKVRSVAPVAHRVKGKEELDKDTLMAIIHNRFHILANYKQNVLLPVLRERKASMTTSDRALYKRAKQLLSRESGLISFQDKERIEAMLAKDTMVRTIYEKSQELQRIWKQNPGSRLQEKLAELVEWCKHAEQSGIESLEEFAQHLRTYQLAPALGR